MSWVLYFVTERILIYAVVSFRILVLASSVTCSASDKTWQCGQIKLTHVECLLGASTEGLSVKVQRWWCGLPFKILTVWAENKIVPIPFMRVLKLNLWLASARSSASCRDMDVFLLLVERNFAHIIKIQDNYLRKWICVSNRRD